MEQSNKRCWNCVSFRAYYTRGFCCIMKEDIGLCRRQDIIVGKRDSCESWRFRYLGKDERRRIALGAIPEIYNKIADIAEILKDETELIKFKNESEENKI